MPEKQVSAYFPKAGKLKVTCAGAEHIVNDVEGKPIACRVTFDDSEGMTHFVSVTKGTAIWEAAFNFELDSESDHLIVFELFDADEEVFATGEQSLRMVLKDGEAPLNIELHQPGSPRSADYQKAVLSGHMTFVEQPSRIPDKVQVRLISGQDISGNDPSAQVEPYCEVWLDDQIMGQTGVIRGSNPEWNELFTTDYSGEQLLKIVVKDKDMNSEDYIGESIYDLWEILRRGGDLCCEGLLKLAAHHDPMRLRGTVRVYMRFFDNYEAESPVVQPSSPLAARRAPSQDTFSSSSSRSTASVSPEDRKRMAATALDLAGEADRLARQARLAADKAKQTAKTAPSTPAVSAAAADSDRAATEAEHAARRASAVCDKLQDPHIPGREMEGLMPQVERATDEAALSKERAERASKDATRISAREAARRAAELSARARNWFNDTAALAAANPLSNEIAQLAEGAKADAAEAAKNAQRARDAADYCDNAKSLDEAMDAAANARRAAHGAAQNEADAEDKYKQAKLLARKAEKLAAKKAARRLEKERELLEEARRKKQADKLAEHNEDLERRKQILRPGDVTEGRMYQGVTGHAYHNALKTTRGPADSANIKWPNACCGPADLGEDRRYGRSFSDGSLITGIPKHEIRGMDRHVRQGSRCGGSDYGGANVDLVPYPIIEQEGVMEVMKFNKPWCWCFGCGCCRCCGEC